MKFFRNHNRHFRRRILFLSAFVLFVLSLITSWYFHSKLSVGYQQKSLQRYIIQQQKDAQQVLNDTALMRKVVLHQESPAEFETLVRKAYGLFVFVETLSDNQEPLFWNSQKIIPPPVRFDAADGVAFQRFQNGYYVVQKQKLVLPGMTNNVVAYVMIPVLHKYYMETKNSQTTFAHNNYAVRKIAIADGPTDFPLTSLDGQTLFYVEQVNTPAPDGTDAVSLVFRLTALLLLLIALHLFAEDIVRRKGAIKGIVVLAIMLGGIRIMLYFLPEVVPLRQVKLFDPAIYGSGGINSSLGALLINAFFLCWLVLFAWNRLGPIKQLPRFLSGRRIMIAGIGGIVLLMLVTFRLANVVHQLVVNSKISFKVTDFSQLDRYTAISFLILALLSLTYYYFSRLLFRAILLAFPNLLYLYFTVSVVGLLFLTFQPGHTTVLFFLPVLAWLVLYTLILTQEQAIINRFRITIAGLLFWIFIFSISLAALIMQGNRERERMDQKRVARKLDQQTDPTKQDVLSIALVYLDNRFLTANLPRFYREEENAFIRDSITNSGMAEYSSAYNTSIYLFDHNNNPVNNPDPATYDELNTIYTTYRQRNRHPGQPAIAYYESSPTRFVYLIRREIFDSTFFLGSLFLVATPKEFQEIEKFYPDIFTQDKDQLADPSEVHAIYRDNKLAQYDGNYPFTERLAPAAVPTGEFTYRENNDFNEIWYKPSNRKLVVVAQKKDTLIESITLFSYLFCAFLFMVGIIRLFELGARIVRTWPQVDVFSRMSIRSQIHVTIIFISVLSFIIIGVATISYFIQRNKRESIDILHQTATNTLSEIEKQVEEDSLSFAGSFSDTASAAVLEKLVTDISDVHGLVVNMYDSNGTLRITPDEKIYKRGVLSTKMDPVAFYHMKTLGQVQRVQNEYLGNLKYQSIYKIVRDTGNQTAAYLNIPYFRSEIKLDQEISNFLVTIINLNAFIVLIAGVIALFITNRITRSFSVIGDKMKAITLGRTNEEIEWNKNDEIGELVKQYNKMVQQLEASASALAKSEREGAWREMARQVAHEIKNPLTPMKLSIQYLQKAIQANHPNVKDLTSSVAGTLIEQIDHLSKIAADFSQFANIGNKRLERLDLHTVIGSLLQLYSANQKVTVSWRPVPDAVWMQADKTHMNRLFTNLLTNAVDACSERDHCQVLIAEQIVDDYLLIAIADNGDGIPAETQSKIFTPNFTTKTSGTGLGLAMCKGIVEQAGGDIWFETKEGEGTTFFVKLPLGRD